MKNYFIITLLFILSSCSQSAGNIESTHLWLGENPNCAIKGNPSNWQAAYCMWLNNNMDFNDKEVTNCYDLALRHKAIPQESCARNKYFKKEICKILIAEKYLGYSGNVEECISSEDTVPKVVKEGFR